MALTRRLGSIVIALGLVLGGCGDDDDDAPSSSQEAAETTTSASGDPCGTSHSETDPQDPATGGLAVPDVPGTCPIPVPSLGFGLAIPFGWEATLLTDDALDQVADARLVRPAFLASARVWAADGAVFYAAGVSDSGAVSDLKVYVEDGVDTSSQALAARAQALADSGDVPDATVAGDPATGRIRVDFAISLPDAENADETIEGVGSELLVADGDRLWRLIITAESPEAQNALLLVFDSSLTFD